MKISNDIKAFWKSLIVNLAVTAIWYAVEYQQFGELQWNRLGDNIIGVLYILILWWVFRKTDKCQSESEIKEDYAESLKSVKSGKPLNPFNFKPSDCKHCYGASAGVAGVHYSCDCKENKMYNSYPLVMCPQDCKYYECENKTK